MNERSSEREEPIGGQPRRRLRELGVSIGEYEPGPHNAITDVEGVRVGHATLIRDDPPEEVGHGAVRTGVTAVWPRPGNIFMERVAGGSFILNGAGEVSGLIQVREWGVIETPILLTNTHAVGAVSHAATRYLIEEYPEIIPVEDVLIPLVGECDDSYLNDIAAQTVRKEDVYEALRSARGGPVQEGSVGGGTGMISFDLKAGVGTSSRRIVEEAGGFSDIFTVGVLVVNNCGRLQDLRVDGAPVGRVLAEEHGYGDVRESIEGSIIVVIATDAPLVPGQLNRLSKRAALGLGRVGSYAAHGSGEIVVAFSTANTVPREPEPRVVELKVLSDRWMNPLYRATVHCTEEAVLNSLCMADEMVGVDGHRAPALPLEVVEEVAGRPPSS